MPVLPPSRHRAGRRSAVRAWLGHEAPSSGAPAAPAIPAVLQRAIALVVACTALLVAGGGQAVAADTPAWVARHGLTSAEYQAQFDRWVGSGYRLISVSGYEQGGTARYAAIWRKTGGPAWQARHGLTAAQYQATFDQLRARGYRPIQVNGYEVAGTTRFAAIFKKDIGVAWVARHGLTPAEYQAEFDARRAQGYRLVHVSGYTSGGAERYAGIWERSPGPAWRAFHGLTSGQYQSLFDSMTARGYRLTTLSGHNAGRVDRYAGIFERGAAHPWVARHGLTAERYQQEVTDLRLQDYSPVQVSVHAGPAGPRFALLWENRAYSGDDLKTIDSAVNGAMSSSNTAGLSLAIAHQGRLVFAKSYGSADKAAGTPLRPSHRLRMASVSKPITSIEIMHLVEAGRLRLDDRVFGRGALLGEQYGEESTYADPRVRDITVQNLLEHTGGGWDNDGTDGTDDPMFTHTDLGADALITEILKTVPLEYTPGTTFQYSNFGYAVLGRVIEQLTGKRYEDAVRDDVLAPSGAGSFAIAGDTKSDRLPDEVAYHKLDTAGIDPYGMKVRRMDAHGGWVATPVDVLRVAVRADGFPTVPDLLNADSMATMATATTAPMTDGNPANYAKGWAVNSIPNWWHTGYLTGTKSELLRTAKQYGPSKNEEFAVYVATNSTNSDRSNDPRDPDLDAMLWKILNDVRAWPADDLF